MTCPRNVRCEDPVTQEAQALTQMLDSGRSSVQVADALRADSYNMSPNDFNRLIRTIQGTERQDLGDNLVVDRDGNLIIDRGEQQGFVVATRDFDHRQRYADQQRRAGHPGAGGRPDQPGRNSVADGAVHAGIGAITGAAIDGKKGAIAGGIGGLGNVLIDKIGGENQRDPVTDTVVKGTVGAGIGALINGRKGAIAGGAGSVVPNVVDQVIRPERKRN